MSAELISILALVAIFVLATTLSVNMGALAFAGAFLVGTLAGGLDADGMYRALFLAWQHAPMSTFALPMVKESIGWGAQAGADAALLAELGSLALPDGYEPPMPDVMPSTPFDREGVDADPYMTSYGTVWEAANTYFKPFAACRYTHAAAGGLRDMVAQAGLTADNVASVEVGTHRGAVFLSEQRPRTLEHAQYSFPHVLAAIILDGKAGAQQICEARIDDPARCALAEKVTVSYDPELDADYPAHYGSRLRVTKTDGQVLEGKFLDAPGDAVCPLSQDELNAKWRDTLATVVSSDVAEAFLAGMSQLDRKVADVLAPVYAGVSSPALAGA